MMNGETYPSGSRILISDIGRSSSTINPGSSLICMTSEVNSQCCRQSDGGNVGEWYFPDGSLVPRNRDNPDGDFTRTGFTQQVRLNRRNEATGPTGIYTCVVPREDGCGGQQYTANITIG